jgi:hypothetical protein
METKVISARVPVDVANMVENACKQSGMSKSAYIIELVTKPSTKVMKQGGNVVESIHVPDELNEMLSAVGGVGVGVLVYKILQVYLPKDKFTEEDRKTISLLGAVGAGMVGFLAMNKALSKR